jgi:hypothetical protein
MIKEIIFKYRNKLFPELNRIDTNVKELLWAQKYQDTIQDKSWLKSISLSPNDMACNYSFLYLLARIFEEFKPKNILEFGLGESTKFINAYVNLSPANISHDIIEHDKEWIDFYKNKISNHSSILNVRLNMNQIEGENIQVFENLAQYIKSKYDIYVIDGPNGLPFKSRYDINLIAERFNANEQFVIIMDDYQREGEKETIKTLMALLAKKGIIYNYKVFEGSKSQILIATDMYKYTMSF